VLPTQIAQFDTWFGQRTVSQPFQLMAHLVSVLGTGVPARFPELKLLFAGGGVSWAPHILQRMDKEYNENRRDVPWLVDRPSFYFKRQMALLTQPLDLPEDPVELTDFLGSGLNEDHLLYASGFPHFDFDAPSRLERALLSDDAKEKVFFGNATRFLPRLSRLASVNG